MIKFKKSTEITLCGGKRFTIYHWSPSQVIRNMPKIGRLVAVPMGTMAGSALTGGENFQDAVPTAILYILDQIEDGGDEIIKLMLEGIEVDGMGGQINIDEVFDGHVNDLFTLLQKVIEVNYGCFFGQGGFGALTGLFQKMGLVKAVEELDQTPETEA
ncbi:hypothetical protein [Salmonella phage SSBI34]|nr:hypothetical protein [Salmonella phage SSBI34]